MSLAIAQAQERLRSAQGQEYWRSLEELAQSAEFRELVEREFPSEIEALDTPLSRRRFLMLMGASLALAGLSGCLPAPAPREKIVPYVRKPEEIIPGRPLYFATAMALAGDVQGLLVESHEGRPTKIEGNPEHPANRQPNDSPEPPASLTRFGPTDAFAQASILSLYVPDRSQSVTNLGNISTWDEFSSALRGVLQGRENGVRLSILTETISSPTLAQQMRQVLQKFPNAKWHCYEPVGTENARAGAKLAFGDDVQVRYQVDKANVILALDADLFCTGPEHVRQMRQFGDRRRVRQRNAQMNRLYAVESTPGSAGSIADHRLPLRSVDVEPLARALAGQLDARFAPIAGPAPAGVPAGWLEALAKDLKQNRGTSLIVVGEAQPAFVHALALAMNDFLGNIGETVLCTAPAQPASSAGSLLELAQSMEAGRVDVLFILGGNPAYTAPADVRLNELMQRVPLRIHLGQYRDETAELCQWHIPEAHFLESWGDARAPDGTVSMVQPLIAPLHDGKTAQECLVLLTDQPEKYGYDIVRAYWRSIFGSASPQGTTAEWQRFGMRSALQGDFEAWWRKALHDGLTTDTVLTAKTVTLRSDWMQGARPPRRVAADDLEIVFRPDPTVFDGRFANNGWLQELPKPLSKLTWDNAAYLSPATAIRLGFAAAGHAEQANDKVVKLEFQGRQVEAPLWVQPGHADNSITVHLGYGRTRAGKVGTGLGFNAGKLRSTTAPWFGPGLTASLTGARFGLAGTQHHFLMENRDLVRSSTLQDARQAFRTSRERQARVSLPTLYNETDHPYVGDQWGMVIDLNVCTGCSACVVACQSENNIPVVGKEEVARGREMHWIRVDRYYKGEDTHNPEIYSQVVPCMHCENAPCELVCPVGATVHSSDGLNDMVYNRCVGTRYCSNNCPYKVRRFNFFQFSDFSTEILRLGRNPDVTVRSRGVMEKCTYCVQRIRVAQIDSQREGRSIVDGEIATACQAVCPTGAIVFGNINDKDAQGRPRSKVAQLKNEPLHYALLEELNTRPRTTYLAAVKNPNPEMPQSSR